MIPGSGAKGVGDTAVRNYDKWQEIRVNMDTLTDSRPISTEISMFGRSFRAPLFAGPVGAVKMHYGDKYDDLQYNSILVNACAQTGIAAFTGDGTDERVMKSACEAIGKAGGAGVPTVKPWNRQMIKEKMCFVRASGAFVCAMDVDAAGLPFLKGFEPPAGSKSVAELAEIIRESEVPFIVKGIMTVKGARKAVEAGAAAIIVSNHGGRVLDQCPATAEVLEEIADEVRGRTKVLIDGGLRTGVDVFKAIAIGADAVLMARPFVNAIYSNGLQGASDFAEKVISELEDTMAICGVASIDEINRACVRI